MDHNGEKPTFDQAFKVAKPKWNDIWAALLFLAVCAGYVAVSAISIQGYGEYCLGPDGFAKPTSELTHDTAATKGFNGGSIYGGSNDFGLDTNTLILFVFCLAVAFVFSYAYMWGARGEASSSLADL